MAVTLDELRAVMRMEMNPFIKDLQKVNGVTARTARLVESTWLSTNKRLDNIGRSMAQSLVGPLLGIGAALSVDSVAKYADAWTSAKNSLSVAGVVGEKQIDVLDQLYKSAQDNAAPLNAMADLFGKAAQAGDNLGASQADLLKFSDGVGVALRVAGSSASQASGALTQLGQLLGQARVQAEEFNSINEGARPILMAVAAGLDEAGGSVSKLKELVNDGKVSGQQFFQAFLKGLPSIQSMAANATQTIEQGMTKVNNAFTRFIGESDESLGASQRLVAGLIALADNFDQTADVVLKVAAVIAGALVGRSIAGMIASLGLAMSAVIRFVAAVRAAATISGLATAMGGLSVAAGPIGAVIGVTAVSALALFASSSNEASAGALTYAAALEEVRRKASEAAPAIASAASGMAEKSKNSLQAGLSDGIAEIERTKSAFLDLFSQIIDNAPRRLITEEQLASLSDLRDGLASGKKSAQEVENALFGLANSNPKFQKLADQLAPLLTALKEAIASTDLLQGKLGSASVMSDQQIAGYKQYAASRQQGEEMLRLGKAYADEAKRQNGLSKEQLAVEKEIASIRKDLAEKGGFLPDDQINALAASNVAASEARSKSGKSSSVKQTADSRFDADIQAVRDRTAALIEEQKILGLTYREQEKRRMALDLEQTALADLREEARRKGATDLENIQLSSQQRTLIDQASEAYARQADALRQVEEAQNRAHNSAQEFYDTAKSGFVDVIKGTQSFSEALSNLASKVADMFLNSAFDSLFGGTPKSSGGLTSFFKMLGFADGGYTGYGAKYAPAGIVHKGEYVFDADAVKKAGGPGVLEALRSRLKGYANGGSVGVPLPTFPTLAGVRTQQSSEPATFVIDVRGATGNSEIQEMVAAGVSQGIAAYDKQMPDRVQQINRNPRRR